MLYYILYTLSRARIYKLSVSFTIAAICIHSTHICIYNKAKCSIAIFLFMTYNTCRKAEVETSDDL